MQLQIAQKAPVFWQLITFILLSNRVITSFGFDKQYVIVQPSRWRFEHADTFFWSKKILKILLEYFVFVLLDTPFHIDFIKPLDFGIRWKKLTFQHVAATAVDFLKHMISVVLWRSTVWTLSNYTPKSVQQMFWLLNFFKANLRPILGFSVWKFNYKPKYVGLKLIYFSSWFYLALGIEIDVLSKSWSFYSSGFISDKLLENA